MQAEALRRIRLGDPDLALEQAGDAGQHHLHAHGVLVLADQLQAFAARHAPRQDAGIVQQVVDALPRHVQTVWDPAIFTTPSTPPTVTARAA